jgi:hypothetical protein
MWTRRTRRGGCLLALAALVGCGPAQPTAPHTGAEEAARDYFEAIRARDWRRGYELLHPDSRGRWSADGFARVAEEYRRRIGFDPEAVHVRSCEEQGEGAKAHVVFEGHAAGKQRQFKEAAELRRAPSGWGVVLPQRFGRVR